MYRVRGTMPRAARQALCPTTRAHVLSHLAARALEKLPGRPRKLKTRDGESDKRLKRTDTRHYLPAVLAFGAII